MRNVFVGTVLGVLVAACAQDGQGEQQDLSSAEGQQQEQDGGSGDNGGGEDAPVPALEPLIYIETISCDRTVARYEASPSGPNFACKWTFDDGSTSNECVGEHEFAVAGSHDFVLEVTDLSTGATGIATQTRSFEPVLELTLDVTGDGLSITYAATSSSPGPLNVVRVEPAELVIADDPNYPSVTSGTVRVREAGTYTVTYDFEDERGSGEICSGQVVKQITLVCDGEGHVH
jgi:hypothetical protein